MGKKKFIDKKKSATFTLVYRESEADDDSVAPPRIFTRVDGGDSYVKGFSEDDPRSLREADYEGESEDGSYAEDEDGDSRFEDADESGEEEIVRRAPQQAPIASGRTRGQSGALPDSVRRELIELGYPDDGYDYMQHMRKIGTAGVGAAFVPSVRNQLDSLRADVKAYDASKVEVRAIEEVSQAVPSNALELVNSSIRPIRKPLSKEGVLDADIIAALENSDGSQFDSADELDDEFVILANEGVDDRANHLNETSTSDRPQDGGLNRKQRLQQGLEYEEASDDEDFHLHERAESERARPARLLDEQFETLAMREYDDYEFGELDEDDPTTRGHADISQFSNVLSDFLTDKTYFKERYETPADEYKKDLTVFPSLENTIAIRWDGSKKDDSSMIIAKGVDDAVVKKTLEYRSDSDKEVFLEESEEEKDHWDCETVVSTFSNFDNHPAKISVPGYKPRIKVQEMEKAKDGIIRLAGKQHLPVDYLPSRANGATKASDKSAGRTAPVRVVATRTGETPEEKKVRKAAIKEERRQARAGKKAMKLCYREESHRAQHGAAAMGPSSIHIS